MKKIILIIACISAAVIFPAQAREMKVGVALANFDLNFISILKKQMETELKNEKLNGQFVDAKGDIALQVQQIDDFINQGVDAIILNPVDTQGVLPMMNAAGRAGIPLIFVNRKPEVKLPQGMAYVGSDSALGGELEMEALARKMNYRGNVAILMGALSNEEARERTRATEAVIAKYKDMKLVEKQTAKWQRNEAVDVVSGWLLNGTPIDAIAANNDEMAIGAVMALSQANNKKVMVAGIDGTPDGVKFVQNGGMALTIFQDARGQATGSVKVAHALLDKQKVDAYTWIPYKTITPDNVTEFTGAVKK
jgi:ribose transport system substrate-binding protein